MKPQTKEKLDDMIACGYPIFIIAGTVAFPAEAEDFLTPEEMDEVEAYIKAERLQEEDEEDVEENNCEAGIYDCDTCPNNGDCIRQNE